MSGAPGTATARRAAACAALVAGAACASQGAPPGGPPDPNPPKLVRITPDTGALNARPPAVVFQFDEVIAERPQGAPTLAGLIVMSPRDGEPRVSWDRDAISVRPRGQWRRNTVYRVSLRPGVVDLRGNATKAGAVALFSTGPSIPAGTIDGVAFDWASGRALSGAVVQASIPLAERDTTTFIALSDSLGRFSLPYLSDGVYRVQAYADANGNRAFDPREAFDTLTVSLRGTARVELLTFVHDSVGPGIQDVTSSDSVTLRVTLSRPLALDQPLAATTFAVRGSDSSAVTIVSATSARIADSLANAVRPPLPAGPGAGAPPVDSTRRQPRASASDSARKVADSLVAPKPSRPLPVSDVVLRLARPLAPGASYRVRAVELRGLSGTPRSSDRVITIPKPAPPPPPARVDSARAPLGAPARPATAPGTAPSPAPRPPR